MKINAHIQLITPCTVTRLNVTTSAIIHHCNKLTIMKFRHNKIHNFENYKLLLHLKNEKTQKSVMRSSKYSHVQYLLLLLFPGKTCESSVINLKLF